MTNYDHYMMKKVMPCVAELLEQGGHKFDNIAFNLIDHPGPAVQINSRTFEITATTGAIKTLQGNNLGKISREMKAVLAHEVGHAGTHTGGWAGLSVFASPLIAIAAYELIRRAMKPGHSKADAAKEIGMAKLPEDNELLAGIEEGVPHEKNKSKSAKDASPLINDTMFTVAKYVAIGALGLAAGGFLARHISRKAEFAADKKAIEFTKDPKALVSALGKLHAAAESVMNSASQEEKGIKKWLDLTWNKFANATYKAHPSLAERTAYINSLNTGITR